MTTVTLNATAAERPIPLRARADLHWQALGAGSDRYWRVKDPVSLKHFELGDEEFHVLQRLDGRTSAGELVADCARRFAPRQLNRLQLASFLARLHRDSLVLADAPGQGVELLRRDAAQRRDKRLWGWSRVLAMRWRGVDPQPAIDRIGPHSWWIFSRWAVAASLLLAVGAVVLLLVHYHDVRLRVPEFQAFFSLRNAPWLVLSVCGAKIVHELAHSLACRRYGGECHELGIMLLVFMPCLYCDVSDAWMFKSRVQRAVVGAAGLYAELVLAAICTLLWWFSEPGWLNSVCFNLMVVCSASTLLFNGNPLLRYDGYFILSDLCEIPNLQQRATAVIHRAIGWCFLATEPPRESLAEEKSRYALAAYAVASTMYRWLASLAVIWFCYRALRPHRLDSLAVVLAAIIVASLLTSPIRQIVQFVHDPAWTSKIHGPRVLLAAIVLIGLAAAMCLLPLPHRIRVPAVVGPAGARRVYVSVPGKLASAARAGDAVQAGQMLAQLVNPEMAFEIVRLESERERLRLKLANLKRQQLDSVEAGFMIPTAREAVADVEQRLRQRLAEQQRLTLVSPQAGTVLPARRHHLQPAQGELPSWSGSPLDPENNGCYLETGTELCLVGDLAHGEAVLVIDEDQLAFVRSGQIVHVLVDQYPEVTLSGTITEIAEIDLQEAPPELVEHGGLPTRLDPTGARQPVRTYYQARVALTTGRMALLAGASGEAKIFADPQPLGLRLLRFLTGTFRFTL